MKDNATQFCVISSQKKIRLEFSLSGFCRHCFDSWSEVAPLIFQCPDDGTAKLQQKMHIYFSNCTSRFEKKPLFLCPSSHFPSLRLEPAARLQIRRVDPCVSADALRVAIKTQQIGDRLLLIYKHNNPGSEAGQP